MIAQHPTIDGVPEELDIELQITLEMYITNVKDAIKTALLLISRGGTNYSPTVSQNQVMVKLLNALGFYSERWDKLLGISKLLFTRQQFLTVQSKTVH